MAGLGDIRDIGSGNIGAGATNVLRTGNKKIAALTVLCDMLKGTLPVIIAAEWGPDQAVLAVLALLSGICSHFGCALKAARASPPYIGVLLGFCWLAATPWPLVAFAITWLGMAAIFRISSLAAIVAMIATPIATWWLGLAQETELMGILSAISIVKHNANIVRLLKGTESRIGSKG